MCAAEASQCPLLASVGLQAGAQEPVPAEDGSGLPWWGILLIVVPLALSLVGAGVALVLRRKAADTPTANELFDAMGTEEDAVMYEAIPIASEMSPAAHLSNAVQEPSVVVNENSRMSFASSAQSFHSARKSALMVSAEL
eukprot:TRINITY_DN8421_c0_g1_i1.p4 TRINITY_DN8421_c0_g1~~TRINITY_DN8421_c0_g1_i1.p4  ORF type:complete len:140 (+),score=25.56 TRINITY_DN8421_c0_g1_i1:828-1247(+)